MSEPCSNSTARTYYYGLARQSGVGLKRAGGLPWASVYLLVL